MNKNSMNLGQYNSRHVIKHVTLKFKYNHVELTNASLDFVGYHYEYNILYIYIYIYNFI